jgi:hypothetical protein
MSLQFAARELLLLLVVLGLAAGVVTYAVTRR